MKTNPYLKLSAPELYAFIFKEWGEDGLRQVLERKIGWKETHRDHAKELDRIGLQSVAKIILEYAELMPSLDSNADRDAWLQDAHERLNRVH